MCILNHCIGKQNTFSFAADFEFCTIFTNSCLHYFSLAKGLGWICHSTHENFHTQLLTVMVSQPCKRLDMNFAFYISMIFTHVLLTIMLFQPCKRLDLMLHPCTPAGSFHKTTLNDFQRSFEIITLHTISKNQLACYFKQMKYSRHTNRIQSLCYVIC